MDGNHENHELLASLPVEEWHGGLVHRVSESILHLMRGQVFDLDGLSVFAMGGAESVDRQWRVPYRSWWPEEIPSADERALAETNLAARGWRVDYVVTHEAPYRVLDLMYGDDQAASDEFPRWLDGIASRLTFDVWYFGHHHIDENHGEYQACFEGIYPLGETEPLPVTSPLTGMANVVALPHIGSATHETRAAMAATAVADLIAGLEGRKPAHLVDDSVWTARHR